MKILAKKVFPVKTGLFFFVVGFVSLFFPHISGWSEIVFPEIAQVSQLAYLFWKILFVFFLGFSILNFLAVFFLQASLKEKTISFGLPILLATLFVSIYPDFSAREYLGIDQRVSFFVVGGRTRILWAGGIETIKNDALSLLTEQTDDEGFVIPETWSNSLKKLGAYAIKIDNESRSVLIYVPKADLFDSDQFIYLITYDNEPALGVLGSGSYRFWKIDEGVYFFQTW